MCAVKKKLAALMLAAAMVLALFPAVLAEGDTLADAPSLWVKPGTTTQENINELWGEGTVEYTQNADGSYTMKLLKNVSMAISANISLGNQFGGAGDPMIILDLNGFDITGTSIVIANYANLTIRDSSAEKSGRVVYDGGAYMAAVNNVGHYMAVEGGTFVCNGAGSATYNAAISTAASVTTEIKGGTFEGGSAGAVISYGSTIISGGEFNGKYGVVSKVNTDGSVQGNIEFPAGSTAVVNATDIAFVSQGEAEKGGTIKVEGGTFHAPAVLGTLGAPGEKTSLLTVTGGTHGADPSSYVPDGGDVAGITPNGGDAVYYVGEQLIADKAAGTQPGDKLDVKKGDVNLSDVPGGVEVTNSGSGSVTVNGTDVPAGGQVTVCAHAWGAPAWNWAADYSGATANFTCTKNAAHTKAVAASVTSEKRGNDTVYTASVTLEGTVYTDQKVVAGEAPAVPSAPSAGKPNPKTGV